MKANFKTINPKDAPIIALATKINEVNKTISNRGSGGGNGGKAADQDATQLIATIVLPNGIQRSMDRPRQLTKKKSFGVRNI